LTRDADQLANIVFAGLSPLVIEDVPDEATGFE